ncbi:MAG TPA: MBL fold metallo-hydrolase [Chloroflexota bacterium]
MSHRHAHTAPTPTGLERLTPHLYRFQDVCNVYLIADGERGILVDFGTGAVLDHLHEAGVREIEWVLHTHHHRDQCQGDHLLEARGVPIAVPAAEAFLFEEAETFWRTRQLYDLYDVTNTFFTLGRNVRVARRLHDYERFTWRGYTLEVVPTPGHTKGSISLVGEIDGQTVAFCGDLIALPGRVWTIHDLQWSYAMPDALNAALYSLQDLRARNLDLLAPSHGSPMTDAAGALDQLMAGLGRLFELQKELRANRVWRYWPRSVDNRVSRVLPHLWANANTVANFYVVMADDGRALFLDYGFPTFDHFNPGGWRFVEHSIPELREVAGLAAVEVLVPSHYHDDHIAGVPYLQERFGTKVWCYENMADILEKPHAYNLPCLLPQPVKVDRTFGELEAFEWNGWRFTPFHMPGHTWYANGIFFEIDGRRVALTGDNLLAGAVSPLRPAGPVYRNRMEADSFARGVERLLEFEPEIILTGHTGAMEVDRSVLEAFHAWSKELRNAFVAVAYDPEEVDFALDPTLIALYPYQARARAGQAFALEVRVRNAHVHAARAEVRLALPEGWTVSPEVWRADLEPRGEGRGVFHVRVADEQLPARRVVVCADVTLGEHRLGQIAEAVVDVLP